MPNHLRPPPYLHAILAERSDSTLIESTLELFRLLGILEGGEAGGEGHALRAGWVAFCDSQPEERRRTGGRASSQREREEPPPLVMQPSDDGRLHHGLEEGGQEGGLASGTGEEGEVGASERAKEEERRERASQRGRGGREGEVGEQGRAELPGGVFYMALNLLLALLSDHSIPQGRWEGWLSELTLLLHRLQPAGVSLKRRKQRLQEVCGRWQAGLIEKFALPLLTSEGRGGRSAPAQGVLLLVLAKVHVMMLALESEVGEGEGEWQERRDKGGGETRGGRLSVGGKRVKEKGGDGEAVVERVAQGEIEGPMARGRDITRLAALRSFLLGGLALLDPSPWSSPSPPDEWEEGCLPLFVEAQRLAREVEEEGRKDVLSAKAWRVWSVHAMRKDQKAREASELRHGTESWQAKAVFSHHLSPSFRALPRLLSHLIPPHSHPHPFVISLL